LPVSPATAATVIINTDTMAKATICFALM
jgi:hypothetical protein